jgi:hypothetical protein
MTAGVKTAKPFVASIKLQQQTPMIHFQHDESGACPRASEVKPKLDRFLFSLLGGGDELECIDKGKRNAEEKDWIIGKHDALNYKMKFEAFGQFISSKPHGMYFGNTGHDSSSERKAILYEQPVEMQIVCFIEELRKQIIENIALFFLLHNFGTRQTKGFGSFLVTEINGNELDNSARMMALRNHYQRTLKRPFIFVVVPQTDADEKFNIAKTLYDLLKGGINRSSQIKSERCDKRDNSGKVIMNKNGKPIREIERNVKVELIPNAYEKSYLIQSYCEKGIGSEKAQMKAMGLAQPKIPGTTSAPTTTYNDYKFLRAMLGLTDTYTFHDVDKEDKVRIRDNSKVVERFASPVLIKIFDDYIVFLPQPIPDEMLNRWFTLEAVKAHKIEKISTPEEFNLPQLLLGFADHFNSMKENLRTNFGNFDYFDEQASEDQSRHDSDRKSELTIEKCEV